MRAILSDAGYAPVVTADPEGLSRIVRAERPKLVLLDLMLPGTDGIELMRKVPELDDIPVVFISAYGRDETIAKALESGAVDYIVKPFSATELVARVRAALRDRAEPDPNARLTGEMLEDEGVMDTIHIGIGTSHTLGGKIVAPTHYDLLMWEPTISVDGRVVQRDREVLV